MPNFKTYQVLIVATIPLVGSISIVQKVQAFSLTANVNATVLSQFTLSQTTPLNFGTLVPSGTAGTAVVNSSGVVVTGGLSKIGSGGAAAVFTIASGTANQPITVNIEPGSNLISGANTLAFTTSVIGSLPTSLNAVGGATFQVGGTLSVSANQPAGVYTGTYTVTVTY